MDERGFHPEVTACQTGMRAPGHCNRLGIGCPIQHHDCQDWSDALWRRDDARAERDTWVRLFNRLEAAITHHKRDKIGPPMGVAVDMSDEIDEALYAARDKILRDAAATP